MRRRRRRWWTDIAQEQEAHEAMTCEQRARRENIMRYIIQDSYLSHPELGERERAERLAHNIWDVVDTHTGTVIYTAEERDADLYARLRNRGLDPNSTTSTDWEAALEAERIRRAEEAC